MSAKNCLLDPLACITSGVSGGVADTATSAWDAVCKSFADAAAELLKAFGQAFAALPTLNLTSAGISSTYGICLAIAATVAALLVFGGVIRTAWTHDGSGIAQAVTGVAKAVLAWMLTAAVATAALQASDEITQFVVNQSFGSQQALADRLGTIVNWAEVTGDPGQAILSGSLLLVFALIGIALVIVLWFELLLRNAAIAVLVATSPIAAAGQASEATKTWWLRSMSATGQLIILKPVIALVFAVGLGMSGTSDGVESLLEGLLVLALAAFSWPVIARFFTFGSVQASNSGLATVLGFLAGQASQSGGGRHLGSEPGPVVHGGGEPDHGGTRRSARRPARCERNRPRSPAWGGCLRRGRRRRVRRRRVRRRRRRGSPGRDRIRAAEGAPGGNRAFGPDGADGRARWHGRRLPVLHGLRRPAHGPGRRRAAAVRRRSAGLRSACRSSAGRRNPAAPGRGRY